MTVAVLLDFGFNDCLSLRDGLQDLLGNLVSIADLETKVTVCVP